MDLDNNDILLNLREATAQLHKDVEALSPFFNDDFNIDLYAQYASLSLQIHGKVDTYIKKLISTDKMYQWSQFMKQKKIAAELSVLKRPHIAKTHNDFDPLKINTRAALLGALYVIEGSALGAKIIIPHLKKSQRFPENFQYRAIAFHNENQKMQPWIDFKKILTQYNQRYKHTTLEIVDNAKETFCKYITIFKTIKNEPSSG